MSDVCTILTDSAASTGQAGSSLAQTLYRLPVTIALTGELGAGKTTFLQGFAQTLEIPLLPSPTYALEQRYETSRGPLLHIDCYRLPAEDAQALIERTEDFPGIRCIEWPAKLQAHWIAIDIAETSRTGRRLRCTFGDTTLPLPQQILGWRADVKLPQHIVAHCNAVAGLCSALASDLVAKGAIVRQQALARAAEVHDLLRFIDFRLSAHPPEYREPPGGPKVWAVWKEKFPGRSHEQACADLLRSQGYDVVADIVEVHGLTRERIPRDRIEQKLLFYADKRVKGETVVTLEERFADFAVRYGAGAESLEGKAWFQEAKRIEKELFPEDHLVKNPSRLK